MFLPHFDVFCNLLLNRRTATWNLLWETWHLIAAIQLTVSCSELYFVRCCALKWTGKYASESKAMFLKEWCFVVSFLTSISVSKVILKGNKGLEKVYLKRKPTCSAFQKWLSFGVGLTWILIIRLRNRSKSPPSWNTGRHIGSEEW